MNQVLTKYQKEFIRVKYYMSKYLAENYEDLDFFHKCLIPKVGLYYTPVLFSMQGLAEEYGVSLKTIQRTVKNTLLPREERMMHKVIELWKDGWFIPDEPNKDVKWPFPSDDEEVYQMFSQFCFYCSVCEPSS